MPMPKGEKMTAKEFFERVPETDDHIELRGGVVIDFASPSAVHQRLALRISAVIDGYIRKKGGRCEVFISPLDVVLDDSNVVQPDVFVVCDPKKVGEKRVNGVPDMVIEILSTNRKDDLVDKLALYQSHGVREYWIVDPVNKKILVYFFDNSDFPSIYNFESPAPVGIYGGELTITVEDML